jgi:hypothetical protein
VVRSERDQKVQTLPLDSAQEPLAYRAGLRPCGGAAPVAPRVPMCWSSCAEKMLSPSCMK